MASKHMATGRNGSTPTARTTPMARTTPTASQPGQSAHFAPAGQEGSSRRAASPRVRTSKRPRRKRSALRVISTLLIVVGVGLLLAAGGLWGYAQFRYYKQSKTNEALAEHVTITDKTNDAQEDKSGCPIDVDWAALKAVNDDVVGWIYVPGTVVNYPVYQGVDNDEYLRTNALGEWSVGGQVFLDWESTPPGMVDHQSVIYGHHLWDGTMFQPLSLLDDQEVFDATDTIWYVTETNEYELQPLFMYYATPYDTTVRNFRFDSDEAFRAYLQEQFTRAVTMRADAQQLIAGAMHVLTMSTCNYYDGYGRSILVAIPKHEEQPVTQPVDQPIDQPTEEAYAEEGQVSEEETWQEDTWQEESWDESSQEETLQEESWNEG